MWFTRFADPRRRTPAGRVAPCRNWAGSSLDAERFYRPSWMGYGSWRFWAVS